MQLTDRHVGARVTDPGRSNPARPAVAMQMRALPELVRRVLGVPIFFCNWFKLRQLIKDVRTYAAFLESGVWQILYRHPHVLLLSHADAAALPNSLRMTVDNLWLRKGPRAISARLLDAWSPSSIVVRSTEKTTDFTAALMIIRNTGRVVLFDVAAKRVYRKCSSDEKRAGFQDVKARLGKVYLVPQAFDPCGEFECEALEDGDYYGDAEVSTRKHVLQVVSENALSLQQSAGRGSSAELIRAGLGLASTCVKKNSVGAYIEGRRHDLVEAARLWPLIPAHRDLTAHNMLVRSGAPLLLDLNPRKAGWAPAFFDCLCLIHSEALEYGRFDLLHAYLQGELDDIVDPLWKNGGVRSQAIGRKDLLLAETLCMAAMTFKISGMGIERWIEPILRMEEKRRR